MSELCCFSNSSGFYTTLLLHDFFFFSSFILSHPLYFSYFIFFSPYLLKFLSFLSPLFITTSLLLLAFPALKFSHHKQGFFLSAFLTIAEKLRSKINEDMGSFEEFEVYKIVFDYAYSTVPFDVIREPPFEVLDQSTDEDCVTKVCTHEEVSSVSTATEERKLENFLELLHQFEKMANGNVEDKKVDEPPCPKSNKVVRESQKDHLVSGSEAAGNIKIGNDDCTIKVPGTTIKALDTTDDNGGEYTSKMTSIVHLTKIDGNVKDSYISTWEYTSNSDSTRSFGSSLGSYGSMRREKEWKRTLACKLFEERHNGGGEEGMDSLWETYETDASKTIPKKKSETNSKKNMRKKSGIREFHYDREDEEEDEVLASGQICCLQALKFSSGKMSFGMGKPNLVKISKAIKGIGWLHHHVSRQGKKVRT